MEANHACLGESGQAPTNRLNDRLATGWQIAAVTFRLLPLLRAAKMSLSPVPAAAHSGLAVFFALCDFTAEQPPSNLAKASVMNAIGLLSLAFALLGCDPELPPAPSAKPKISPVAPSSRQGPWLPSEQDKDTFDVLRKLGAKFAIDSSGLYSHVELNSSATMAATNKVLPQLKELKSLSRLSLCGDNITDGGLAHLKGLSSLYGLYLNDCNDCLAMTDYRCAAKVTDAGLVHLKELTGLQELRIFDANITDAGLENLRGLKKLTYIRLVRVNITDAGLLHLEGLKSLNKVHLWKTQVTEAGKKRLGVALPDCVIE